jgi:P-type Ca2+ transporter type 2C
MTTVTTNHIAGLTDVQVLEARGRFGKNQLNYKKENPFIERIKRILKDPMMILLMTASAIYFISGKVADAIFLLVAIVLQISISFYQNTRSKNALEKLKALSVPQCKVIRNGQIVAIPSEDVVIGDSLLVEEGTSIPADATIVHANDFSVNESILTGESLAVFKNQTTADKNIYSGTNVSSGSAIATIYAIGNTTKLGTIGASLEHIQEEKTPLEIQIAHFVRNMAYVGAIIFLIVWGINYWHTSNLLNSLLQSLTLAMSILPEEIPIAFTTFMAIGAWRLMKSGIVVKQMKTVETLGSATVICTDKTGTITENKMSIAQVYILSTDHYLKPEEIQTDTEKYIIQMAMWASETIPFDPMEIALKQTYDGLFPTDDRTQYTLIKEYALQGVPPIMTHVFENNTSARIIASKGAPEALILASKLSPTEKSAVTNALHVLANDGFRVLGIATSDFKGTDFPEDQHAFSFQLIGLVAFYDPPKKNIEHVLQDIYRAGISVKIITGDNAATTMAIAKQIHFKESNRTMSGKEIMEMPDRDLAKSVMEISIFTRMFPEAKLKVIKALKSNHQVVAMTGDGVNDGPALKEAHIGIAMGKKGTEIAKQAASLILLDDDLSKIVEAIAMGRRIYTNLKKAIQYIISIHIPIILTVFIPLALGWIYPNIFSPIHIIFLEIIMGPTCSIIYEREPMEKNTMKQKPKALKTNFFQPKELSVSMVQGLAITAGTLSIYQFAVANHYNEELTRTMIFTVLITANIFLTLVNRSFYYSIFTTMHYKNKLVPLIIFSTIAIVSCILFIRPLSHFFAFEPMTPFQLATSLSIGFISVIWFELFKWLKRMTNS